MVDMCPSTEGVNDGHSGGIGIMIFFFCNIQSSSRESTSFLTTRQLLNLLETPGAAQTPILVMVDGAREEIVRLAELFGYVAQKGRACEVVMVVALLYVVVEVVVRQ